MEDSGAKPGIVSGAISMPPVPFNVSSNMEMNDLDLKALGISVVDQISLERRVEAAVDEAVLRHERKQKMHMLEKDIKDIKLDIKKCGSHIQEQKNRLAGMRQRVVDPRQYFTVERELRDEECQLRELFTREKGYKERFTLAQSNEAELDKIEIEEGEIASDADDVDEGGSTSLSSLTREKLVREGKMTPFGTFVGGPMEGQKELEENTGDLHEDISSVISSKKGHSVNDFERYLQDQISRQQEFGGKNGPTVKGKLLLTGAYGVTKKKKKLKEFIGSEGKKRMLSANTKNSEKKGNGKTSKVNKLFQSKMKVGSQFGNEAHKMKVARKSFPILTSKVMTKSSDDDDSPPEDASDDEYLPSDGDEEEGDLAELNVDDVKSHEMKSLSHGNKVTNKSSAMKKAKVKARDDGDLSHYVSRMNDWKMHRLNVKREKIVQGDEDSEDEEGGHVEYEGGFKLPTSVADKLYKYQLTGVRWMWELHCQGCGGILGDEMGLGKTIQVIAFLAGLSYSGIYSRFQKCHGLGPVLIVCPATVLHQWVRECHKWWAPFRVAVMHESGSFAGKRTALIHNINKNGGILVTSYTGVRDQLQTLLQYSWHYIILDEGHKIRNPEAQITVAVKRFSTPHRLILSGSPIQNSLKELWSLFDFIFPGKLGTLPVFLQQFAVPITQGGYANASKLEVQTAFRCASILRDSINPYLLRRMKNDVKSHLSLPEKSEQVLFCDLSEQQRKMYRGYIDGDEIKRILNGRMQVFVGLMNLRKICNHPDLFSGNPTEENSLVSGLQPELQYGWWQRSGKMHVLHAVLKVWWTQKHRVLLFTQSRQMMGILELFLREQKYSYLKMDGTTTVSARQPLIDRFNSDTDCFVFLLTTKVGGLGINLTGANRVVIFDPDWNPSTDTQARERAWRIGQLRDVTIYRLLTSGTIEEKIYHRQIFKQFLTNRVLKDPKQQRFFKTNDLYELFTLQEGNEEKSESSAIFYGIGSEISLGKSKRVGKEGKKAVEMKNDGVGKHPFKEKMVALKEKNKKVQIIDKTDVQDRVNTIEKVDVEKKVDGDIGKKVDGDMERMERLKRLAKLLSRKISAGCSNVDSNKMDENVKTDGTSNIKDGENDVNKANLYEGIAGKNSATFDAEESKDDEIKEENCDEKFTIVKKSTRKRDREDERERRGNGRKWKKFEGERVDYLVKRRRFKFASEEDKMGKKTQGSMEQNEYILRKLLRRSGVHTALSHDVIVNSSDPDYLLVEGEAERVAKEALTAVRASRAHCFRPMGDDEVEVMPVTSTKKTVRFGAKRNQLFTISENKSTVTSNTQIPQNLNNPADSILRRALQGQKEVEIEHTKVSGGTGLFTSSQLLVKMKQRSKMSPDDGVISGLGDSVYLSQEIQCNIELLTDIRNFVAFQARCDGQASTEEIVARFRDRLPPEQTPFFRALLKEVCEFNRDSMGEGMWKLKGEFR